MKMKGPKNKKNHPKKISSVTVNLLGRLKRLIENERVCHQFHKR
jgi:hypothetical protein